MRSGIRCKACKDVVVSKHRHDFVHCKCGACFVDGGRDYLRYGGTLNNIEIVDVADDGTVTPVREVETTRDE
jgi:hypothetical protein